MHNIFKAEERTSAGTVNYQKVLDLLVDPQQIAVVQSQRLVGYVSGTIAWFLLSLLHNNNNSREVKHVLFEIFISCVHLYKRCLQEMKYV